VFLAFVVVLAQLPATPSDEGLYPINAANFAQGTGSPWQHWRKTHMDQLSARGPPVTLGFPCGLSYRLRLANRCPTTRIALAFASFIKHNHNLRPRPRIHLGDRLAPQQPWQQTRLSSFPVPCMSHHHEISLAISATVLVF
jgi:hypothetical protein